MPFVIVTYLALYSSQIFGQIFWSPNQRNLAILTRKLWWMRNHPFLRRSLSFSKEIHIYWWWNSPITSYIHWLNPHLMGKSSHSIGHGFQFTTISHSFQIFQVVSHRKVGYMPMTSWHRHSRPQNRCQFCRRLRNWVGGEIVQAGRTSEFGKCPMTWGDFSNIMFFSHLLEIIYIYIHIYPHIYWWCEKLDFLPTAVNEGFLEERTM